MPLSMQEASLDRQTLRSIRFTVPGRPRPKVRPWATSVGPRARVYSPRANVIYEHLVREAALTALGGQRLEGPIKMVIVARMEVPKSASKAARADMLAGRRFPTKRPDLDNIEKAVLDACNGVAFRDDADRGISR